MQVVRTDGEGGCRGGGWGEGRPVRGEFGLQSDGGETAGVRGGRRRGRLRIIRII